MKLEKIILDTDISIKIGAIEKFQFQLQKLWVSRIL